MVLNHATVLKLVPTLCCVEEAAKPVDPSRATAPLPPRSSEVELVEPARSPLLLLPELSAAVPSSFQLTAGLSAETVTS